MLERLRAPLTIRHTVAAALLALLGVTLYCLAYTAFAGSSESPIEALAWGVIHVLPWLAAFELGKRSSRFDLKALLLACAFACSLLLGLLLGEGSNPGFEITRRVPGVLLAAALLVVAGTPARERASQSASQLKELPVAPDDIAWVAAAGNYVELHCRGKVVVHRAPLALVEAQLAPLGFIRLHRSTLVQRSKIARLRPLDIILDDGTSLKVGKRYRAFLP